MTQTRIFFLHNPKAGGSSLRSVLSALSPGGSTAPVFGNAPNDHRQGKDGVGQHRGFDIYAGHYGYDAYQQLADGHLLFTNFRDPVQRIHSMYRYWRHNVALDSISMLHPGDVEVVRIAHTSSFSEFIRNGNEDLKLYISDFHFRQLHCSGWEPLDPQPCDMSLVKGRIGNMPWFYIAETPDASRLLLDRLFPSQAGQHIPRDNQSAGRSDPIRPEDAEYLARMNRLDYDIYDHALAVQRDRLDQAEVASLDDGNQLRIAA